MRALAILVLGLSIIGDASAHATASRTVEDLYRECKAQSGFCYGYLMGIADEMGINDAISELATKPSTPAENYLIDARICGDYTDRALAQAFINWAERNPKQWTKDMELGATDALKETWGCHP